MPDAPNTKHHGHPARSAAAPARARPCAARTAYAELAVTSNFTFLTGASHPDEMAQRAAELGHSVAAIADVNTLAGVVRAHVAAKDAGIPLAVGCRLRFGDPAGLEVLVYPTDRAAYGRLARLLTAGKRRASKGECHLTLGDMEAHAQGLLGVVVPPDEITDALRAHADRLRAVFDPGSLAMGARHDYGRDGRGRINAVGSMARMLRLPTAAINDVRYHDPSRRPLQDALTCIRHGCSIEQAGFRLEPNAERCLKDGDEMARLFHGHEDALERSVEIAQRASAFSLDGLRYEYPEELVPSGSTPMRHLADLTWEGARRRYPDGLPVRVRDQILHELALIEELRYAPYFLTCEDIVRFARSRGILCQGRGAAANSAVCYCLGVTSVDPDRIDVLFERFVSRERDEPPDIDIDFEHERREEVIQRIYAKYGRERAALTAEVITYRGRSAVREVGKAMGLSLDCVDQLAGSIEWWDSGGLCPDRLRELGLDPEDPTMRRVAALTQQILGFPRHLSQHVGGFVISRGPLCETVPIENAAMPDRTVIEWDKDDIDALGILKVDVLGLGMLTCLRKGFELVERHHDRPLTLATVPPEDGSVYDMICRADTVGVFQIESRAQMTMLPRLRPRCFYDLVIEVAIVRPGPIQGDMVHPYLRRRTGEEPVTYPHEDVRRVLGKTLGVPLFQEQAMQLAVVAAGFTPGEADQLRRAMAAWRRSGSAIERFGRKFVGGMLERGYEEAFALRCFEMVKGFSEYGFPESHAASFALLVYASAWLKRHYPAAFSAALLNSQPMGFYQPAQIVRDAQEHGVEVRPVDVNHSAWDCTLESDGRALRLGMRLVRGLREADGHSIAHAAAQAPFRTVESLRCASGASVPSLRCLARADAFASMGLDRRRALWAIAAMRDAPAPLFEGARASHDAREQARPVRLPAARASSEVSADYAAAGLSLKAHPIAFLREELQAMGVSPNGMLSSEEAFPHGRQVRVAGVVLNRQRPGTASGIVFMTLEDETGIANLIIRPRVYERWRRAARHGVVIACEGRVERQGAVVHVQVRRIEDLSALTPGLDARSRDFH